MALLPKLFITIKFWTECVKRKGALLEYVTDFFAKTMTFLDVRDKLLKFCTALYNWEMLLQESWGQNTPDFFFQCIITRKMIHVKFAEKIFYATIKFF